MSRVTDTQVRHWLTWARNYEEIESFEKIASGGRCWLIRVTPDITVREGTPLMGFRDDESVPAEMVLTAREALVFAFGCAVGGRARSRTEWTQADWEARAERQRAAAAAQEAETSSSDVVRELPGA